MIPERPREAGLSLAAIPELPAMIETDEPGIRPHTGTAAGSYVNYATVRRVIELPVGRQKATAAL